MAIKVSGTTVIDNSCNITNANTFTATTFVGDGSGLTGLASPPVEVLKPENTLPADGATGCLDGTVLCGSEYYSLYDKTHTCTCFQVSLCSDFSTCNFITCELAGACRSLTINPEDDGLVESTQHFFRLRYEDADGCCSDFSDATCFTTGSYFPDTFGASVCGGFYMGTIFAAGTCYYLILSPNSGGCVSSCQWKTSTARTGVRSTVDGYGNTYNALANASHPAGNWTATRTINAFSDWYLPAFTELTTISQNCACVPAGEGFFDSPTPPSGYWSSTENSPISPFGAAVSAYFLDFSGSPSFQCGACQKTCGLRTRAIRRVPF